jgi:hypothetical protein
MVTIRNTVVVAIMQVGVIVAGVLAAGVCHRMSVGDHTTMPFLALALYSYGVLGLLIPLAWVTGAVVLQLRANISDSVKVLMFWLGILLLISLAIFVFCVDAPPLLRGFMDMHSNNGGMDDGN